MSNKEILQSINNLDTNDMKKLFNSYLLKTKKSISNADSSLEVIQHAHNLNIVLMRDIDKFVNWPHEKGGGRNSSPLYALKNLSILFTAAA